MAAGNPLWDIHNALWTMLEAKYYFTSLVPEGNRIKFTATAREIFKRDAKPADHPEVAIVQTGAGPKDRTDSTGTQLNLRWEVWVSTLDQPFDPFLEVQWAVFRGLLCWDTYLKDTLTWQGDNYVKNCELLDVRDSLLETIPRDLRPPQIGWSSVWMGETWCVFKHTDLIAGT